MQVADRWHLWRNLGNAVERVVAKHRACLQTSAVTPEATVPPSAVAEAPVRQGRLAERTRRRHAAVHTLLAQQASLREVAAELGLSRNTVRRFARAASAEELLVNDGTGRRRKLLDTHAGYVHQRWSQGCRDAARLWQELLPSPRRPPRQSHPRPAEPRGRRVMEKAQCLSGGTICCST